MVFQLREMLNEAFQRKSFVRMRSPAIVNSKPRLLTSPTFVRMVENPDSFGSSPVGQQAVGVFVIVVGRDGQAAVEEAQVETHVHLAGLLPAQVVHGEACGIDAAHAVVDVTRGVGIEVVVVADLLVAGDTPADADLGVVERATREIHEIFCPRRRQAADTEGKLPQRFSFEKRDEPSRRKVAWIRYFDLKS